MKNITKLLVIVTLLFSCAYVQHTDETNLKQEAVKSVVMVRVSTSTAGWLGTGFSIHKDRGGTDILTNKHICSAGNEGSYIINGPDGVKHKAWFVRSDMLADVCIIRTEALIPALQLGSRDANPAEHVSIIGCPHGYFPFFSDGWISGYTPILINTSIDGREFFVVFKAQLASAVIYPGNSGSPVLNDFNEVVGIVFATHGEDNNMSLIVPVGLIKQFLNEKENVKTGWQ